MRRFVGVAVSFFGISFSLVGQEQGLEQIRSDYHEYLYSSYEQGGMPEADRLVDYIVAAFEFADSSEVAEQSVAALHLVMGISSMHILTKEEDTLVPEWKDAVDRLTLEYVNEPSLAMVIHGIDFVPPALEAARDRFLEVVTAETKNSVVRAALCLEHAKRIMRKDMTGGCDEEEEAALPGLLERLASEFGSNSAPQGQGDFATLASRMKYEWENLRVGCKAPDLEGVDGDGVPFKLSDYAGKVIFLDFWAHW